MYVCLCKGVTDHQIRERVAEGARSWSEIRRQTGCATQCGKCACEGKAVTREAIHERMTEHAKHLFHAV